MNIIWTPTQYRLPPVGEKLLILRNPTSKNLRPATYDGRMFKQPNGLPESWPEAWVPTRWVVVQMMGLHSRKS